MGILGKSISVLGLLNPGFAISGPAIHSPPGYGFDFRPNFGLNFTITSLINTVWAFGLPKFTKSAFQFANNFLASVRNRAENGAVLELVQ